MTDEKAIDPAARARFTVLSWAEVCQLAAAIAAARPKGDGFVMVPLDNHC